MKVLLLDDEHEILRELHRLVGKASNKADGMECYVEDCHKAYNIEEAKRWLLNNIEDNILAFIDWNMPGTNGPQAFSILKKIKPDIIAIMVTAHKTHPDDHEESIYQYGFFTHINKRDISQELMDRIIQSEAIKNRFESLEKRHHQELKTTELEPNKQKGAKTKSASAKDFGNYKIPKVNIICKSPIMLKQIARMDRVCTKEHSNTTVLILGETGTGKELFAKHIHNKTPERCNGPFVACTALPRGELLHTALFGIWGDTATGVKARAGRFELAHGGTIFLDDVETLSITAQTKLLRILQEKVLEREGIGPEIYIDVRVVASTNKNLRNLVQEGAFREDLYFRLKRYEIGIPPLNKRREDIPRLIGYFFNKYAISQGKITPRKIKPEVIEFLCKQDWIGNVRLLESKIEDAIIDCGNEFLSIEDFDKNPLQEIIAFGEPPTEKRCQNPFPTEQREDEFPQSHDSSRLALINLIEDHLVLPKNERNYSELLRRIDPDTEACDDHSASNMFHQRMRNKQITDRIASLPPEVAREKWPCIREYYYEKTGYQKWKKVLKKLKRFIYSSEKT